jgi:hypothetical protein
MKKIAPFAAGLSVMLVGLVYVVVRARAGSAEPMPNWSCHYVRAPVAEVPASLIERAGFRDREELKRFVEENETALHWTYLAVQSGLRTAEREVMSCFERQWNRVTPVPGTAEARLVWHLTSDGKTAVAEKFELAALEGPSQLAASARECLERHLFGKTFQVRRASKDDLVKYRGVFPFHRKLHFVTKVNGSAAAVSGSVKPI